MSTKRTVIKIALEPIIGSRFQPTGFPDLGAAVFDRPLSTGATERMLLVESAQSMANRLEGTAWDAAEERPVSLFDGLPYVRVSHADDGRYLTSSRTESHRLASAFVRQGTVGGRSMVDVLVERLGVRDDTPLDHRRIARAVFELDPFCLVHGVFFSDSDIIGQPKIARAITGIIEAAGVSEAVSGGVKKDHVRLSLADKVGGTAEGYGSVPFSRIEYTAESIMASFVIDQAQIASYGLPDEATELLTAIAEWEIVALLDDGLRLRTACDFVPVEGALDTSSLRSRSDLEAVILGSIETCAAWLPSTGAMGIEWSGGKEKKKK